MDRLLLKEEILGLNIKRKIYIDKYEDSWDEELLMYAIQEPKEIDECSEQIFEKLKKGKEVLDVDFIIEILTHLGDAPNILYDDNGNFAVENSGYQTVSVDEKNNMSMTFFVESKKWKSTIRSAIIYYLENDEE